MKDVFVNEATVELLEDWMWHTVEGALFVLPHWVGEGMKAASGSATYAHLRERLAGLGWKWDHTNLLYGMPNPEKAAEVRVAAKREWCRREALNGVEFESDPTRCRSMEDLLQELERIKAGR